MLEYNETDNMDEVKKKGLPFYVYLLLLLLVVGIVAVFFYQKTASKAPSDNEDLTSLYDESERNAIQKLAINPSDIITTFKNNGKHLIVFKGYNCFKAYDITADSTHEYLNFNQETSYSINDYQLAKGQVANAIKGDNGILLEYTMNTQEDDPNNTAVLYLDANKLALSCYGTGTSFENRDSCFTLYTQVSSEADNCNLVTTKLPQKIFKVFNIEGKEDNNKYLKEGSYSYIGKEGGLHATLQYNLKKDGRATGYYNLSSGEKSSVYRFIGDVDMEGNVNGSAYNNDKKTIISFKLESKEKTLTGVSNVVIFKDDEQGNVNVNRNVNLSKFVGNSSGSTPLYSNSNKKEDDELFRICYKRASFPGGRSKLTEYLKNNVERPNTESGNEQGEVVVAFVVEPNGSITNILVQNSVSPELDAAAVRAIENMPKWNPARDRYGRLDRSHVVLSVPFSKNESAE